jgi:hypothetical protein
MLLDLPSRQDYEVLTAKLDQLLALAAQPVQAAADDFLSIEQVAAYTRFDRRTVEQWVKQGRFNERGKKVYLPAYEYSGRLRFKRGDVEAFGLGVGVLTPSLTGERPEPTKVAPAAKKTRKLPPIASDEALRVA